MRKPPELGRDQCAGRARGLRQRECVALQEVVRVSDVAADLEVAGSVDRDSHPARPLADGPVVPVVDDVARGSATEGQVHEFATEGGEVLTHREAADFPVDGLVQVGLGVPELGDEPGLATTIEFLYLLEGAQVLCTAEIVAVAVGDRYLEL